MRETEEPGGTAGESGVERLEFESFRDFIDTYSPNISREGIFVETPAPRPVGSRVDFAVYLSDDFRLLEGSGEVIWTLEAFEVAGRPPGMALRFVELDDASERLISRLVTNYEKDGGRPFDLKRPGDAADLFRPEEGELPPPVPESLDLAPAGERRGESGVAAEARLEVEEFAAEPDEPFAPAGEALDTVELLTVPELELPAPIAADAPAAAVEEATSDVEAAEGVADLPPPGQGLEPPAAAAPDGELPPAPETPLAADLSQISADLSAVAPPAPPRQVVVEEDEEQTVVYAGTASARGGKRSWAWLLVASVAGVGLGAAAYFFADEIKGLLGLGEASPAAPAVVARAPETGAAPAPAAAGSEPATAGEAVELPAAGSAADATADGEPLLPGEPGAGEGSAPAAEPGGAEEETAALGEPEPDISAPAAPAAQAAPITAAAAASRVETITWRDRGARTIVRVSLDGALERRAVELERVDEGAPREVIKIAGIRQPFAPTSLAVASRHVRQIRVGYHETAAGSALHLVADLTGTEVRLDGVEVSGTDIFLTFTHLDSP